MPWSLQQCIPTQQFSWQFYFSIKLPTESGNWPELKNNLPNCDLCGGLIMGISVTDCIHWASNLEVASLSTPSHISSFKSLLRPHGSSTHAILSKEEDPPILFVLYLKINIDPIFFLHCLKFFKKFIFHLDRSKYRKVWASLKTRRHSGNYVQQEYSC